MRFRPLALTLLPVALLTATVASAAPTCTSGSTAPCGGRIVAEPEQSVSFL